MPASYSSQRTPRYYEDDVITEWPRRVQNDKPKVKKQSGGRRMVRSVARFCIAVLIGVGDLGVAVPWGRSNRNYQGAGSVVELVVAQLNQVTSRRSGIYCRRCKFRRVGAATQASDA